MDYLNETFYFDFQHPAIQRIIEPYREQNISKKEKAVALYFRIRDDWRYNPYLISFNVTDYQASHIAEKTEGHCIEKSILLIACLRALEIPARLHLAKVKNHIAVERLEEKFGTNVMTPHGMLNLYLDDQWVKASPAFNASLCERCNVAPLDFDGEKDAIMQAYNREGNAFMEYLEDYGHFPDVPIEFIQQNMRDHYPEIQHLVNENGILRL